MKVQIIFDDWQNDRGDSVLETETDQSFGLSSGDFHPGSTFNGSIELNMENEIHIRQALADGFMPVFWMTIVDDTKGEAPWRIASDAGAEDLASKALRTPEEQPRTVPCRQCGEPVAIGDLLCTDCYNVSWR